ncbi:glutathione synthase [Schizopora paradoxa]|uniref:Glutathione synthetase n=1 Tax=Schizopora paradoxa TaxID=27342 RepID=A0A0H2RJG1_9AGAM|nr:glutathione synthase [Schizopora paradoxa]
MRVLGTFESTGHGSRTVPVTLFVGNGGRRRRKLRSLRRRRRGLRGDFTIAFRLGTQTSSQQPRSLSNGTDYGRYLLSSTGYFNKSPSLKPENLPLNETTKTIVDGLAAAHRAYGNKDAYILFVVQDNERNVFDQRWLEYGLLENHSIRTIRQSLTALQSSASLSKSRALLINSPLHSDNPLEISTIYFRATYTPTDFPTVQHWETRILLQRSRAINCPSLPLQLAGGKKVQQVLTQPGVLEDFLLSECRGPERFTEEDVRIVRESWVEMWGLDDVASAESGGEDGVQRALARAEKLVLKPQREGGGNNVYRSSIPAFLETLLKEERAAWIAMQLIEPPKGVGNYLVRAGGGSGGAEGGAHKADVVSELGMFGWALFGEGKVKETESGGWLVRTKGRESDEGGVAVGFSVLDSVLLVD